MTIFDWMLIWLITGQSSLIVIGLAVLSVLRSILAALEKETKQ